MKRIVLALAITALLIPLMGTFEPAEARVRWGGGADFSVGGIFFSLGFGDYGHGRGPGYYYRTNHALNYRGYQCGSACFISDGYAYHDRYCPLLQRHFSHFRFDAVSYWAGFDHVRFGYPGHAYGPWVRGYRYGGRQDWHHSRRYDHRYDGRYDRRDHRRGDRGRYDSNQGPDRHGGNYDRGDRDGRKDQNLDRRDGGRDRRRDSGKAKSTRSRSRSRHN